MAKTDKPRIAPALERGLTILEMLAESEAHLPFGSFPSALGVSKASTARLLRVLRERGYAVKDAQSGRYRPGPRMAMLGQRTALVDRLRREVEPILGSLVARVQNTAVLIYWAGAQMQCLSCCTHPASIPMQRPGNIDTEFLRAPWGWIFCSAMSPSQVAAATSGPAGSAALRRVMARELQRFGRRGYAYDDRVTRNTRRLAAPVYDHTGRLVGALGLGGNPLTIPDARVGKVAQILMRHAKQLSEAIGWQAPAAKSAGCKRSEASGKRRARANV